MPRQKKNVQAQRSTLDRNSERLNLLGNNPLGDWPSCSDAVYHAQSYKRQHYNSNKHYSVDYQRDIGSASLAQNRPREKNRAGHDGLDLPPLCHTFTFLYRKSWTGNLTDRRQNHERSAVRGTERKASDCVQVVPGHWRSRLYPHHLPHSLRRPMGGIISKFLKN